MRNNALTHSTTEIVINFIIRFFAENGLSLINQIKQKNLNKDKSDNEYILPNGTKCIIKPLKKVEEFYDYVFKQKYPCSKPVSLFL